MGYISGIKYKYSRKSAENPFSQHPGLGKGLHDATIDCAHPQISTMSWKLLHQAAHPCPRHWGAHGRTDPFGLRNILCTS